MAPAPMPSVTFWQKTKTTSKAGFDKTWKTLDKLGAPVNKLSNKLGCEAFWPTTLDKESEKAARILRSFCKDGFYNEEKYKTTDGPTAKQRVIKKIPVDVIKKAKGLAIFTTMRSGLWVSGAGGSGILVSRTADGSWSPPSGILLHTAGLGFLVGVDVYDCVIVLNTQKAVDAFSKWRATIGGELSAVAGPVGMGGYLESEVHTRQAPVFTYLKSRGFYAGVQIDGTVMIERTDENERFYGQKISCTDILAGKIRHPPYELRMLMETLKSAQGDTDVDESALSTEPPPADFEVVEEGHLFGVPDKEDPDPFGVLALEKEGLHIKEAGTLMPAPTEAFEFKPKVDSPVYDSFNRKSWDSTSQRSVRSSYRRSTLSSSIDARSYSTSDTATQTDLDSRGVRAATPKVSGLIQMEDNDPTNQAGIPEELHEHVRAAHAYAEGFSETTLHRSPSMDRDDGHDDVEIHEVKQATAPQVITRARVVTVPKRVPPKLPPRNPIRSRGPTTTTATQVNGDDFNAAPGSSSSVDSGSPQKENPAFVSLPNSPIADKPATDMELSRDEHPDSKASLASSPGSTSPSMHSIEMESTTTVAGLETVNDLEAESGSNAVVEAPDIVAGVETVEELKAEMHPEAVQKAETVEEVKEKMDDEAKAAHQPDTIVPGHSADESPQRPASPAVGIKEKAPPGPAVSMANIRSGLDSDED